jgi:Zinc finger, C2H2 type
VAAKHLPASLRPHGCPDCSKRFVNTQQLRDHRLVAHDGGGYVCLECGLVLTDRGGLRKHAATVHGGERRFGCAECGKRFGQSQNLRKHVRTVHEGSKPFVCSDCSKALPRLSFLVERSPRKIVLGRAALRRAAGGWWAGGFVGWWVLGSLSMSDRQTGFAAEAFAAESATEDLGL